MIDTFDEDPVCDTHFGSEEAIVKKLTFTRKLTPQDYEDLRVSLGNRIVQEGEDYMIVAFENAVDHIAFLVATGKVVFKPLVSDP